jgi:hypothetical protein
MNKLYSLIIESPKLDYKQREFWMNKFQKLTKIEKYLLFILLKNANKNKTTKGTERKNVA